MRCANKMQALKVNVQFEITMQIRGELPFLMRDFIVWLLLPVYRALLHGVRNKSHFLVIAGIA